MMNNLALISIFLMGSIFVRGQVEVVRWNFDPLTGGTNNFGPSPYDATFVNANSTVSGLIRGSGIAISGTGAASAWGGTAFNVSSLADAISGNKIITFEIEPNLGFKISFEEIAPYNVRRSGTGPTTGQWQYSINGGTTFSDISSNITWGTNTTARGNDKNAIDLSGINELQNVTSRVIFRLVIWGASAVGGTFYLNGNTGSGVPTTHNQLIINASEVALPVTLLSFSTIADKQNQHLSWTYESPERFDYFEVEHSRDGKHFNALSRVLETAIASRAYKANYTHMNPGAGIHYYRLKMVDLDGSFSYSQVIQGRIEGSGVVRPLSTFISSDGFNVSVDAHIHSLELRLADQLGRTVFRSVQTVEAGVINIPAVNLGVGLYFLQVNVDGVMETFKLVR